MNPEHRRERTTAGRHHLAESLRFVRQATRNLEDVAREGSKAELLRAMEIWEDSVKQAREAAGECENLLGEEVEAWMQSSR